MQHVQKAEPAVIRLLLMWAWYYLAQRIRAMRAKHRAVAAAAFVAGSGNPSGA